MHLSLRFLFTCFSLNVCLSHRASIFTVCLAITVCLSHWCVWLQDPWGSPVNLSASPAAVFGTPTHRNQPAQSPQRVTNGTIKWLRKNGQLDQAEPMYREVYETCRSKLGEDHGDTLAAASNLSVLLQSLHKLPEAEPLCRYALERRRVTLGPKHPDTLASVSKLASIVQSQGQLHKAEVSLLPSHTMSLFHIVSRPVVLSPAHAAFSLLLLNQNLLSLNLCLSLCTASPSVSHYVAHLHCLPLDRLYIKKLWMVGQNYWEIYIPRLWGLRTTLRHCFNRWANYRKLRRCCIL